MTTAAKKALYHFGLLPGAPFHAITLGGVSFVAKTAKVSFDANGDTIRSYVDGHYARLTDEQVKNIRRAAKSHFVRVVTEEVGEGEAAKRLQAPIVFQVNPRSLRFPEALPTDESVEKWLYLEPAKETPHETLARKSLAEAENGAGEAGGAVGAPVTATTSGAPAGGEEPKGRKGK